MRFQPNNKEGAKSSRKGVHNKDVKSIREAAIALTWRVLEHDDLLEELTKKELLDVLLKLFQFTCPKPDTIKDVTNDDNGANDQEIFEAMVRATRPSTQPPD